MLIHRIAAQLHTSDAFQTVESALAAGEDATLAVSQSGRMLMLAAQFARAPRPTVYIVSGEDAADRAARSLAAYVGAAHVARFPERADYPWKDTQPDDAVVAARCAALGRLARGEVCIVVSSARALLRCVPPRESRYWASVDRVLRRRGGAVRGGAGAAHRHGVHQRRRRRRPGAVPRARRHGRRLPRAGDRAGAHRVLRRRDRPHPPHGDLDGQTIGDDERVQIFPCRELALTDDAVHRLHVALYAPAQSDPELAAQLELADARVVTPELDRYMPFMYERTEQPARPPERPTRSWRCRSRAACSTTARAPMRTSSAVRRGGCPASRRPLRAAAAARLRPAAAAELRVDHPRGRRGDGGAQDRAAVDRGVGNRFISRVQEVVANRLRLRVRHPGPRCARVAGAVVHRRVHPVRGVAAGGARERGRGGGGVTCACSTRGRPLNARTLGAKYWGRVRLPQRARSRRARRFLPALAS